MRKATSAFLALNLVFFLGVSSAFHPVFDSGHGHAAAEDCLTYCVSLGEHADLVRSIVPTIAWVALAVFTYVVVFPRLIASFPVVFPVFVDPRRRLYLIKRE